MNAFEIIARHVGPSTRTYEILVTHSILVTRKAREIARALQKRESTANVDLEFLTEAALLHDIGIFRCSAPGIACVGSEPYVRHGILGRAILEDEGLPRHALVCERHTGAGITAGEVRSQDLPLPERDYVPESIEEKIICVADKFFSKSPAKLWLERSPEKIARKLGKFGNAVSQRWEQLSHEILGPPGTRAG